VSGRHSTAGTSKSICRRRLPLSRQSGRGAVGARSHPAIHYAFYEFPDLSAAQVILDSDTLKGLIAEFDRVWGTVTRTREVVAARQIITAYTPNSAWVRGNQAQRGGRASPLQRTIMSSVAQSDV
jgi:hypothetical protein